jgi:hypothetical protein
MTDVPTLTSATQANFATLNPLQLATSTTISGGNLNYAFNSGTDPRVPATIGVTSGKWYFEQTLTSATVNNLIGWWSDNTGFNSLPSVYVHYYSRTSSPAQAIENSSGTVTGTTLNASNGDVIGVALDYSTGTVYFYRNNTLMNTVSGMTLNGATLFPLVSYTSSASGSATSSLNFGQRPFAYTPPTGFVALNTFNLPTPTIGATASTQANKYFDISLWSGDNTTSRLITNSGGFRPDLTWVKARSTAGQSHNIVDSVRGLGANVMNTLYSDKTDSETGVNTNPSLGPYYGAVGAINSNGFTVTAGSGGATDQVNKSGTSYVAWQWKANGTGSSNTAGSITSTVSANTSSGFSVVTYTAQSSGTGTIGHGLGVAPSFIIVKNRATGGIDWNCYHKSLGATKYINLNLTSAANTSSSVWGNTEPTSTVFTLGSGFATTGTMVAYCFSAIAGYSAFTSYTGNGSSDGTFCHLGFRPRFVMIKNSSATGAWIMYDTARDTSNVVDLILEAQSSSAEGSGSPFADIDFLSNGFKIRGTSSAINTSGNTYVVAAFAENPFKYSLGR